MSFGKLYGLKGNSRTNGLLAIIKENKLDVELIPADPVSKEGVTEEYCNKYNKLGKLPTFVGKDGFILSELVAIAVYLTSQNEKTSLLGKTKEDYASILQWISFTNMEFLVTYSQIWKPTAGLAPYNKKSIDAAEETLSQIAKVFEDHFLINTYLVGERVTLADVVAASMIGRTFEVMLGAKWRANFPNLVRWHQTIINQPIWTNALEPHKYCEEPLKYQPPAKEQSTKKKEEPKPKAAAAASKAKPKEQEEEEDERPAEPKPKHPLEALGKASIPIDEWKRKYKNEETREVALPWFWQNIPFDEYSIWAVDYKYNDELTLTFMTSNLIGGFFARLEASRKFIQGCCSVFGQSNDSVIKGAFVIRGQDALAAFDVAPDWESYEFTRLDPKKAEDREFFDDMMAWDKPVTVGGKKYEWADGKIFV